MALARTAASKDALLVNYCVATSLIHENGKVAGLHVKDAETGKAYYINAKAVINATGLWVNQFHMEDGQAPCRDVKVVVASSWGMHIVVDRIFCPVITPCWFPKPLTAGFCLPCRGPGKTILGTTDTPRRDVVREPLAFREEVDFTLNESARYLTEALGCADVKSIWVGLRALVKPADDEGDAFKSTKSLSRQHTILFSQSELVTVTGGKWTCYRAMTEVVLDSCFKADLLPNRPGGVSDNLELVGAQQEKKPSATNPASISMAAKLRLYWRYPVLKMNWAAA